MVVKNKFKNNYKISLWYHCLVGHTGARTDADKRQRGDVTSYVISGQERTQEREVIEIGPTENRCPEYFR